MGKNEPVCIADEVPFEIPESWEWVTLKMIAITELGKTLDKAKNQGDYKPYLCSINVYWNGIDLTKVKEARFEKNEISKYKLKKGDLLICEGGDVGRSAIWENDQEMYYQNALHRVRFYGGINPYYFRLLMECYKGNKILDKKSKGMTIKHLVQTALNAIYFPLPPIQEQQRIVDKFQSLIPILEQYNTSEIRLSNLNIGFPELLKKSILQEAVQGKLVPQDPADEPASLLLERIRAEKQKLIAEGKIKKDKHESVIFRRDNSHYEKRGSEEVCIDDEIPFEIPDTWEWIKLSDLTQFVGGYAYKSKTFIERSEYQVLRLGNVKNDEIRHTAKPVFISKELAEKTANFRCKPNDILLTMTGTRLKKDYFYTVVVSNKDTNYFLNQRVGCLREYYPNINKWLIWVLKSEGILSQVFKYETGTANQGNLGAENIMKTFIPLPPLNEQNRICNMIERLLKKSSAL